jgi:sugar phosphate isomerase/epimerase
MLEKRGIVPYTFGVAETSANREANRKLFDFARLIGAKLIVVEPSTEDWDNLESLVREYDIRLAIHNHDRGTTYGDPQAVRKVLAARDPRIGVCLDVGWITQAGFDAAKVFREYQGRVYDIHFKDKRVGRAGEPAVDTVIGKGSANYSGLFAAIRESDWAGVMAIETDSEEYAGNPQAFVTAARGFFSAQTSSRPEKTRS